MSGPPRDAGVATGKNRHDKSGKDVGFRRLRKNWKPRSIIYTDPARQRGLAPPRLVAPLLPRFLNESQSIDS